MRRIENFIGNLEESFSERYFIPWLWRREKYKGAVLDFLTEEEYRDKYRGIVAGINGTLVTAQTEWQQKFQKDYPFVGVVIFGSWSRGDVHTRSDLDLSSLVIEDVTRDEINDFCHRLDAIIPKGISYVDFLGDILVTNKDQLRETLQSPMYRKSRLITPYTSVKEIVASARPEHLPIWQRGRNLFRS